MRLRTILKHAAEDAILDAAERTFAEKGVTAARMEDIAARAGVAVGTLYNYFADRDRLLDAVLERRSDELLKRVDQALQSPKFEDRLSSFVEAVISHFANHPGLVGMIMEGRSLLPSKARRRDSKALLLERAQRLIDQGIDQGYLRAEGRVVFPEALLALLRSAVFKPDAGQGVAPSEWVRIFLDGARAR